MQTATFWGFGAVVAGAASPPAVSFWTQLFSGEQVTLLITRLIDGLPATLMALAALITAVKARQEVRQAARRLGEAKENTP